MIVYAWLYVVTAFQLAQIKDVFLAAFVPQQRLSYEQLVEYFDSAIPHKLASKPLLRVALDNDTIIGFALFEPWQDKAYYLAEMAVARDYQKKGIGKKLVFSIFEKDLDANKIVLVTAKNNVQAQNFYKAIGFEQSDFTHPSYPERFVGYEYARNSYIAVKALL